MWFCVNTHPPPVSVNTVKNLVINGLIVRSHTNFDGKSRLFSVKVRHALVREPSAAYFLVWIMR